jgi:hypothetical protein
MARLGHGDDAEKEARGVGEKQYGVDWLYVAPRHYQEWTIARPEWHVMSCDHGIVVERWTKVVIQCFFHREVARFG